MPPVQRTFQLVPDSVFAKPISRPPMTSKAAKKAYLKANQGGPKVSRAEQRRLDREEVERLNREHEREKASAKAKAAREKKAAKANAEREERRRKGVPEPSRFVRASQPTISRFVRTGNKRTLEDMEEGAEDDNPADHNPANDTVAEEGAFEPILEEVEVALAAKPILTTYMEPPAKKIAMEASSDDEFGEFPSLSQSDILQRMDSPMPSFHDKIVSNPADKESSDPESDDFPTLSQCDLLEKCNLPIGAITISRSCTPNPQRPPTTSPPEKKIEKTPREPQPLSTTIKANTTLATVAAPRNTTSGQKIHTTPRAISTVNMPPPKSMPSRYPLHGRSANIMPPPALPKVNKATSFPSAVSRYSAHQTPARGLKTLVQYAVPTPTQAFLENNLEDFFPSPSQEIRELLDDVDDMPSNTQIAMELGPAEQKPKDSKYPLGDLFPTPDCAISSQDMLDMDTPSRPPNQQNGKNNGTVHKPLPGSSSINPATISHVPNGTNKPTPIARNDSLTTATNAQMPLQQPRLVKMTRESPRNETAPAHYIPPSHITNRNNTHPKPHCDSTSQHTSPFPQPPPIPPKTPLSPPRKRRFFIEKPEDQLHAVLWESKMEAEAAEKARQQVQAREKAQQQAEAQAKAKEQVKESPSSNKRTFQRAQSSVTDYGDDDFSGCSQELLALCY